MNASYNAQVTIWTKDLSCFALLVCVSDSAYVGAGGGGSGSDFGTAAAAAAAYSASLLDDPQQMLIEDPERLGAVDYAQASRCLTNAQLQVIPFDRSVIWLLVLV